MKKVLSGALIFFTTLSMFVGCYNGQPTEEKVKLGRNSEKNTDGKINEVGEKIISSAEQVVFRDGKDDCIRNAIYVYESKKHIETEEAFPDIRYDEYDASKVCVRNSDFQISEDLLNNINYAIDGYGGMCSFYVVDIETNMTFGYNPTAVFPTASTVKAPFCLYALKEIENGNGSLEEVKVYESRFMRGGSGVMQFETTGTVYTMEQLIFNTINWSDNIAYSMVHHRFWSDRYNNMLEDLGCDQFYLRNGAMWGYADAKSMALIWKEIYKYSQESEVGRVYFDMLINALYSYIQPGVPEYKSAHKSGWTESQCHDGGIVFGKRKYIITTLTDNSGNWSGAYQIQLLTSYADQVIDEYDDYLNNKNKDENKKLNMMQNKVYSGE